MISSEVFIDPRLLIALQWPALPPANIKAAEMAIFGENSYWHCFGSNSLLTTSGGLSWTNARQATPFTLADVDVDGLIPSFGSESGHRPSGSSSVLSLLPSEGLASSRSMPSGLGGIRERSPFSQIETSPNSSTLSSPSPDSQSGLRRPALPLSSPRSRHDSSEFEEVKAPKGDSVSKEGQQKRSVSGWPQVSSTPSHR